MNQGHGNDRVWKALKAMKSASHPSGTIWKAFLMLVLQPSLRLVKENLTFTGEASRHRSDAEYHVACAHFERELTLLLKAVASFS